MLVASQENEISVDVGGVSLFFVAWAQNVHDSVATDCPKVADGPAVTSIVVAAGEVGSGTAGAAGGKHFSNLTPRGVPGHPERHVRPWYRM